MSRFFIDRPVFAWVIAIVIMLAGALSITSLPIAQYPSIAPPAITIIATYPGASAKTLEDTVTQVIEQKLNGIDHLRYIESASTSDRHADAHGHLRGRHRSRHRAGAGAKQSRSSPRRSSRRKCSSRACR